MGRGLDWTHVSGHEEEFLYPELMGGGAALFDMEGDGDLDVFLVQSGSLVRPGEPAGHGLFANRGDGTFEDVSLTSGVQVVGYGQGVAAGDADGDGDVDLYITNAGPNVLLLNDGSGRFEDATAGAGVGDTGWGTSAAFFDKDQDGDLDLFVTNYIDWSPESERPCFGPSGRPDYCGPSVYDAPARDVLYENLGDGTFRDISVEAGVQAAFGNALGVVPGDFDGDGHLDLFVANDMLADQLWMSRGQETFEDMAPLMSIATDPFGRPRAGMGVHAVDIDEDDDLDLLVVHLAGENDGLFRNEGTYFSEATTKLGLSQVNRMRTRFGVGIHDFDNDGLLDIFQASGRVNLLQEPLDEVDLYAEPNVLLRGELGGGFAEVLPEGGTSEPLLATSRGAAFGDLDGDGALDVVVVNRDRRVHLLHNLAAARTGGHWLRVQLEERAGASPMGASVTVLAGDRRLRREYESAYSYCSASDPRAQFGLGALEAVEGIVVRWADGTRERFPGGEVDRELVLTRGQGSPEED